MRWGATIELVLGGPIRTASLQTEVVTQDCGSYANPLHVGELRH
jgi:hypothetical protein